MPTPGRYAHQKTFYAFLRDVGGVKLAHQASKIGAVFKVSARDVPQIRGKPVPMLSDSGKQLGGCRYESSPWVTQLDGWQRKALARHLLRCALSWRSFTARPSTWSPAS